MRVFGRKSDQQMNSINLIRRLFLAMIMMGLLSGCETFSGYDMEAVNRKTVTVEAARVEFASGDSVRWGVLSQKKKRGIGRGRGDLPVAAYSNGGKTAWTRKRWWIFLNRAVEA